ncbi:unnamed protein product [Notodromas monacha]|uniref:Membrane insertase YidC/Oxa/ALB C-terminal domain-containing protein n=1 Tax=Notodromas monacha TaxID=399045 RepID=A0A7R9BMI2_9CRUS|nr:unnamed protein product [Notodromas monacha]CAG0917941.1 unnamed protein product [Notodromas monacha]
MFSSCRFPFTLLGTRQKSREVRVVRFCCRAAQAWKAPNRKLLVSDYEVSRCRTKTVERVSVFMRKACASSPRIPWSHQRAFSTSCVAQSDPSRIEVVPSVPYIPELPPLPTDAETNLVNEVLPQALNALGEPTLASLGLGSNWPAGLVQQLLEAIHVHLDIPWWGAITIITVAVRMLVFPLVISAQRNGAHMTNNLPQMQVIQMKLTEARQSGNFMESTRYAHELMAFMKEKNISPLKNMMVPLAQAPVFVSVFIGLRKMANYPVESMTTGGMLWFTDLTVPDPFYALPLITCCTMYLTIKLGADGASLANQQAAMARTVLKFMPIAIFPFIMNFPGAILVYWVSTNFISLAQVSLLRIPTIRAYFKIPKQAKIDVDALPMKQKSFGEGLKDSWSNMKIAKQLEDRQRVDDLKFRDAGTGPLVKTYKYDPTKQKLEDVALKGRQS